MTEKLKELLKNSYSPYTKYPVAAIVVTKDNKEFYGVNVEDASIRAGACAERVAIFSAIAAGTKKGQFKEIHLMPASGKIITPCFVCRQMLVELFDLDSKVYCHSTDGRVKIHSVKELCPYIFGEDDLK